VQQVSVRALAGRNQIQNGILCQDGILFEMAAAGKDQMTHKLAW